MTDLASVIRDVPDFPKKGIMFKDITTLLKDPAAFRSAVDKMAEPYRDMKIDAVVGAEARGFIFGAAMAYTLGVGFIPVRKPGKLPARTLSHSYELEYGTDTLEIHADAVSEGERILVVDDLLATGGTVGAVCSMVEELKGTVAGVAFLIELSFLDGRSKLPGYDVRSLVTCDGE